MPRSNFATIGCLLVVVTALTTSCGFAADERPGVKETWDVLQMPNKQRVGWGRSVEETIEQNGEQAVRTSLETRMTFRRFGQTLSIRQLIDAVETLDGRLLSFRMEISNPPAAPTVTSGEMVDGTLKTVQTVDGRSKATSVVWKSEWKAPSYPDRVLAEKPLKAGETASFEVFLPEFLKPSKVTVDALELEETAGFDGAPVKCLKTRMRQSVVPGADVFVWVTDAGDTVKTSSNMGGITLETYRVPRDVALKAVPVADLDLAVASLIRVKPIPTGLETVRAAYRISSESEDPAKFFAASSGQTVRSIDGKTIELSTNPPKLVDSAPAGNGTPDELNASLHLQADDAEVRNWANAAAGTSTRSGEIARKMERYVKEHLTQKGFSIAMASAAEVARTKAGDCTEHAMLLAAMLRVKQIPSRVVAGLVLVDGKSFGGHMWTEAKLGDDWIPLDATLARGGVTAVHLKMGDAALEDGGPTPLETFSKLVVGLNRLKIETLSAEGAAR